MVECAVLKCQKYETEEPEYYFQIPNDCRRKSWLKFTEQNVDEINEDSVICSLHFEKRFIIEFNGIVHLSSEAYPTIRKDQNSFCQFFERIIFIEKIIKERNYCRFCFQRGNENYSLIDLEAIGINTDHLFAFLELSRKFSFDLPKTVCTECFEKIKNFWEFKIQCNRVEPEIFAHFNLELEVFDIPCKEEILDEDQLKLEVEDEERIEEIFLEVKEDLYEEEKKIEEIQMEFDKEKEENEGELDEKEEEPGDPEEEMGEEEESIDPEEEKEMITKSTRVILKKYKCKIPGCGKLLGGLKAFKAHKCDVTEFRCNYPNCLSQKVFTSKHSFHTHLNSHLVLSKKNIKKRMCPMCKLEMVCSMADFKKHRLECPKKGESISCEICSKVINTLSGYTTHKLYCSQGNSKKGFDGNPLCNYCGMLCSSSDEYTKHMESAHKDKLEMIPCPDPDCGKKFVSQARVYTHFWCVHKRHENQNCEICGRNFKNRFALKDHQKIHSNKPKIRKHECQYCGKKFVRGHQLKTHVNSHTREVTWDCEICKKSYTTKHQMLTHKKRVHDIETGK